VRHAIQEMSDRLLRAVLPEVEAGACVAEQGDCCSCYDGYQYHFDCYGTCRRTSLRCTIYTTYCP
jgi:hypothetical protein